MFGKRSCLGQFRHKVSIKKLKQYKLHFTVKRDKLVVLKRLCLTNSCVFVSVPKILHIWITSESYGIPCFAAAVVWT